MKHSALLSWNILKPRRALSRNWCNREGPNCLLLLYTIHFTNPICLGRRSLKVKMLKSYTTWMALDWPWILDFRTSLQLTAWFTHLAATGAHRLFQSNPGCWNICNLTIRMIGNLLPLGPQVHLRPLHDTTKFHAMEDMVKKFEAVYYNFPHAGVVQGFFDGHPFVRSLAHWWI